jgi:hypothetical protein
MILNISAVGRPRTELLGFDISCDTEINAVKHIFCIAIQ